jgi:hypothetical protein
MNITSKIYLSNTDISNGTYQIGSNPTSNAASIDISLFNTIYNIPVNTSFKFGPTGALVTIPILAGQYSLSTILATMKTSMQIIINDCDVYRDPITGKMSISSPTTPSTQTSFVDSSDYLRLLLGVDNTIYTGILSTAPRLMQLYPGVGIFARVDGMPWMTNPAITRTGNGQVLLLWAEPGGIMRNDDFNMPRIYPLYTDQAIRNLSFTFYDTLGNIVNLNGGNFTVTINLCCC